MLLLVNNLGLLLLGFFAFLLLEDALKYVILYLDRQNTLVFDLLSVLLFIYKLLEGDSVLYVLCKLLRDLLQKLLGKIMVFELLECLDVLSALAVRRRPTFWFVSFTL